MSLTISTGSKRLVLKISDEESEKRFKQVASFLLNETDDFQFNINGASKALSKMAERLKEAATDEITKKPEEKIEKKYKGFLLIECEHCHKVRAFCSKYELGYYTCKCGRHTPFKEPLVKVDMKCECGKHYTYYTNRKETAFDINCLECGSPVAVKYNEHEKCYQTIE